LWEAVQRYPGVPMITYNLACYACVLEEWSEAQRLLEKVFTMDARFKAMALEDPDLEAIFGRGENSD
jgi:hypothetical protein